MDGAAPEGTQLTEQARHDVWVVAVVASLLIALLLVAPTVPAAHAEPDTTPTSGAAAARDQRPAPPPDPGLDPDELRRLKRAAPRRVSQVHPELELAEPYFGNVGEEQARAASAVTGEPLGVYLTDHEAATRVASARRQTDAVLAIAGLRPTDDLSADLRAAAKLLDVGGDPAASIAAGTALRDAALADVAAPVLLAGIDPAGRDVDGVLRAALAGIGHDPGAQLDRADVTALEAAAASRAAPLVFASRHHPGRTVDRDDLAVMVRAVGHDPGASVQASDVAAALGRSRTLHVGGRTEVSPGLAYQRVVAQQPGGTVVGHLLTWRVDDERVAVRTEQTAGFAGRASVPAVVAARPGVVAAVNGGFWLDTADPDGLLVTDGELLSDPTMARTWIRGRRAGFALRPGGAAVGAPDWTATVAGADPDAGEIWLRGVNRAIGDRDIVVYTPRYGSSTGAPPGTLEITVAGTPSLTSDGLTALDVTGVGNGGNATIAPGTMVVAASGPASERLIRLAATGTLHLRVDVPDRWEHAAQGLTGGPLMLQAGRPTSTDDWRSEGFAASHTDRRHPRSLVGFDDFGRGYVLVLDGRQPGYSVGATQREATLLARALGLTDALMLDGGGSSQLVVRGALANRPCCDVRTRPVATAITFSAAAGVRGAAE